jgi:hypothetical protein
MQRMGQKTSCPILTQTEKQPKPKNQPPHNPTVGWDNYYATRPHKEQKIDSNEMKNQIRKAS